MTFPGWTLFGALGSTALGELQITRTTLVAGAGAFNVVGVNAGLTQQLGAQVGAFTLTPKTATLTFTRKIVAGTGVFTLTGVNARLSQILLAGTGAYVWTGRNATLTYTRKIITAPGAFVWSGINAGLSQQLGAAPGAFVWEGANITLTFTRKLSAAAGVFAWAGANTGLTQVLTAAPGVFTLAGNDAALTVAHKLFAGTGAYTISFTRRADAAAGVFNVVNHVADVIRLYHLTAAAGAYALAGQTAFRLTRGPVLSSGAYVLSPGVVSKTQKRIMSVAPGGFLIHPYDVGGLGRARFDWQCASRSQLEWDVPDVGVAVDTSTNIVVNVDLVTAADARVDTTASVALSIR